MFFKNTGVALVCVFLSALIIACNYSNYLHFNKSDKILDSKHWELQTLTVILLQITVLMSRSISQLYTIKKLLLVLPPLPSAWSSSVQIASHVAKVTHNNCTDNQQLLNEQ